MSCKERKQAKFDKWKGVTQNFVSVVNKKLREENLRKFPPIETLEDLKELSRKGLFLEKLITAKKIKELLLRDGGASCYSYLRVDDGTLARDAEEAVRRTTGGFLQAAAPLRKSSGRKSREKGSGRKFSRRAQKLLEEGEDIKKTEHWIRGIQIPVKGKNTSREDQLRRGMTNWFSGNKSHRPKHPRDVTESLKNMGITYSKVSSSMEEMLEHARQALQIHIGEALRNQGYQGNLDAEKWRSTFTWPGGMTNGQEMETDNSDFLLGLFYIFNRTPHRTKGRLQGGKQLWEIHNNPTKYTKFKTLLEQGDTVISKKGLSKFQANALFRLQILTERAINDALGAPYDDDRPCAQIIAAISTRPDAEDIDGLKRRYEKQVGLGRGELDDHTWEEVRERFKKPSPVVLPGPYVKSGQLSDMYKYVFGKESKLPPVFTMCKEISKASDRGELPMFWRLDNEKKIFPDDLPFLEEEEKRLKLRAADAREEGEKKGRKSSGRRPVGRRRIARRRDFREEFEEEFEEFEEERKTPGGTRVITRIVERPIEVTRKPKPFNLDKCEKTSIKEVREEAERRRLFVPRGVTREERVQEKSKLCNKISNSEHRFLEKQLRSYVKLAGENCENATTAEVRRWAKKYGIDAEGNSKTQNCTALNRKFYTLLLERRGLKFGLGKKTSEFINQIFRGEIPKLDGLQKKDRAAALYVFSKINPDLLRFILVAENDEEAQAEWERAIKTIQLAASGELDSDLTEKVTKTLAEEEEKEEVEEDREADEMMEEQDLEEGEKEEKEKRGRSLFGGTPRTLVRKAPVRIRAPSPKRKEEEEEVEGMFEEEEEEGFFGIDSPSRIIRRRSPRKTPRKTPIEEQSGEFEKSSKTGGPSQGTLPASETTDGSTRITKTLPTDAEGGIDVDIMEKLANTEGENFDIFVRFARATGLDEILKSLGRNDEGWTVFVPRDRAFEAFIDSLSVDEISDYYADLILRQHVVRGQINFEDIDIGVSEIKAIGDEDILVNKDNNGVSVTTEEVQNMGGRAAFVEITDIQASNGVIHVIDDVLVPNSIIEEPQNDEEEAIREAIKSQSSKVSEFEEPFSPGPLPSILEEEPFSPGPLPSILEEEEVTVLTKEQANIAANDGPPIADDFNELEEQTDGNTVWDKLNNNDLFQTFANALQEAELSDDLSRSGEAVTIFAPTDSAFEKLGSLPSGDALINVLGRHIFLGRSLDFDKIIDKSPTQRVQQAAGQVRIEMLNDDQVVITRFKDDKFVNGVKIIDDINSENGIIYVISDVISTTSQPTRAFEVQGPRRTLRQQLEEEEEEVEQLDDFVDEKLEERNDDEGLESINESDTKASLSEETEGFFSA